MDRSEHRNIRQTIYSLVRKMIVEAARALLELEALRETNDDSIYEKKDENKRNPYRRFKVLRRNKRFL
jgi:hypothetical protein